MIAALVLGRGGSVGFPGKNTHLVLGRPLMEYPILAAKNTIEIDEIYVSTDSDEIKSIARKNNCFVIDRPDYLCTKEAKHQDAMVHGLDYIKKMGKDVEMIVLLQCNAPFILNTHLKEGIDFLRDNLEYDSAATVSEYSAFTPARARLIDESGSISNFMSDDSLASANSERESQGKIYFTDGTFIVRPHCLERLDMTVKPYPWTGRKSHAIMNWGGFDVDVAWQIPQVEYWLLQNGFTDETTPYDL